MISTDKLLALKLIKNVEKGMKLYSQIVHKIKCLSTNRRQFLVAMKKFLLTQTFYLTYKCMNLKY
jgi:hypothetical protein